MLKKLFTKNLNKTFALIFELVNFFWLTNSANFSPTP